MCTQQPASAARQTGDKFAHANLMTGWWVGCMRLLGGADSYTKCNTSPPSWRWTGILNVSLFRQEQGNAMRYHQLTSEERYMISALRRQGIHQAEIARNLGRHRSTICREVTAKQRSLRRPLPTQHRRRTYQRSTLPIAQEEPVRTERLASGARAAAPGLESRADLRTSACTANTVDQPRDDLSAREARSTTWRSAVPASALLEEEVAQDLPQP